MTELESPSSQSFHRFIFNFTEVDVRKALGVPRFGIAVIGALTAAGHAVDVVTDRHERKAVDDLLRGSGVAAERLQVLPSDAGIHDAQEGSVEILTHHFQSACTSMPSILILYDFHAFSVPWKYKDAPELQERIRAGVERSSAVITPFPYTYFNINRYLGMGANKTFLMPSPLMLDVSAQEEGGRTTSNIHPSGELTLLYPAQLQEHKNHAVLLAAVRLLTRRRRVSLVLTGSHYRHDVTQSIERLIERLDLTNSVSLRGIVTDEELADLYRSCDVTVCPSLSEGGAYLALEAVASGARTVVAEIPPAREHLRRLGLDDRVVWFDPSDAADLAAAILHCLTTPPASGEVVLPTWSDYAECLAMVAAFVRGEDERPHVCIDSAGRYLGLDL